MKLHFTKIWILLATLTIAVNTSNDGDELWCYECNADLSQGRKGECNDPYSPASVDRVLCPRNDSYVCLKSLIFYRNVHVTVRGCVPKSEKSTYCSFKEAYPEASLECLFCNHYACNVSPTSSISSIDQFLLIISSITILLLLSA